MKKSFCILVCIIPIVMNYKSIVPGVDLATLLIVMFGTFYLFCSNKGKVFVKRKTCEPLFAFIIYTAVSSVFSLLLISLSESDASLSQAILRGGKFFAVIFLVVFVLYEDLFDKEYAFKVLRTITLLAVFYAFVQFGAHYIFGINLPSRFLDMMTYGGYSETSFYVKDMSAYYRVASFFIEPAAFIQYIVVYLSFCMFSNKEKLIDKPLDAILITAAIILTASGQGLIILVVAWGMWYVFKVVLGRNRSIGRIVIMLVLPVAIIALLPWFLSLAPIQKNFSRIFEDGTYNIMGGYATQRRLGGYSFLSDLIGIYFLIGRGYGNVRPYVYYPSVAYTMFSSGIIGILLVAILIIWLLRNCKTYGKYFAIMYSVLIVGTTAFFGCNICFYFPFLLADVYSEYGERNKEEYTPWVR